MRSESDGKLRAQSSAGGGYSPRQSAPCPDCGSRNTYMSSGGNGGGGDGTAVRYFTCRDGGHRFSLSVNYS